MPASRKLSPIPSILCVPLALLAGLVLREVMMLPVRQAALAFDLLGPDGMAWTFTGARQNPVNPESRWHYAYTNCTVVTDEKAPKGFRLKGMNCALVRIDPKDGAIHVVGKVTHTGMMAFVGRDLYLAGGDKYLLHHNKYLRRAKGIVPK